MMSAGSIFTGVCLAKNAGDALRALDEGALAALILHLRARSRDGSVTAVVLAMAEFEAVERFLKIQENKA